MKLIFFFILTLFFVCSNAVVVETASFRDFLYGTTEDTEYDNWLSHVSRGIASSGYNQYAPFEVQENGFGDFVNPGFTTRTRWNQVIDEFVAENFVQAQALIDQFDFPYNVVEFHNTDTGDVYYMLREVLNMDYFTDNGYPDHPEMHVHGSFDYGWGLFVFNPSSNNPIVITAPHPKDDFITVPVSYEAFYKWDARYMLLNGAGREVMWTNIPPYWNSKSLSDPSRNSNHPFHLAYRKMCDEIRDTFGRREWSAQIHSFDYTHMGYNNLQISAGGWDYDYPGHPIRDISNSFVDVVNATPYVVLPANTVGNHDDVLVTDYYSVLYDLHGLYYQHGDSLIAISNNINLPGAAGNNQMSYSRQNWNGYDVFCPTMHIEMEELPSAYPQTMSYYYWFYGYDAETGLWDTENFYTNALTYYTPWVDAFAEVLPAALNLENDIIPPTPENFSIDSTSLNNVFVTWDRVEVFDFYSYEILYSTEPIDLENENYSIFDRSNNSTLASQAFEIVKVTGLSPQTEYYFAIRVRDYSGNLSEISEQVSASTGSAAISNFRAFGYDSVANIAWTANSQLNNNGFNIYRRGLDENEFELIASYEEHESLEGSEDNNVPYSFADYSVDNHNLYVYKISSVDEEEQEYFHTEESTVSVQPIYTLTFSNMVGTITDDISFGINHFASDGYNNNYDIVKGSNPGGNHIYAHFYQQNWSAAIRQLQQEIRNYYDLDMRFKTWTIRATTNQLNQPITIELSDNYQPRNSEKIWLRDNTNNIFFDLTQENLTYQASSSTYRYFTLYWGNLLPVANISSRANQFLQPGDTFSIGWTNSFNFLVDNTTLLAVAGEEEYVIVSGLDAPTTSYVWTIPEDLYLIDANIVVRYETTEGFLVPYYSNYKIGVVPSTHTYTVEPGWHLRSNPLTDFQVSPAQVFGPGSELYTFIMEGVDYVPVSDFYFGEGYWLYTPDYNEFTAAGTVQKLNYDHPLVYGWNLVPNVLKQTVELKDLILVLGDDNFTFVEALNYQFLNRGIYVNNQGLNELRYTINSEESFWVYSNVSGLSLRYRPFNNNLDHFNYPFNWEVDLIASQNSVIRDKVTVGNSPHSTDDYDFSYDLPKPPSGPAENDIMLYLTNDFDGIFNRYEMSYKTALDTAEDDSIIWQFNLIVQELEPVVFSYTSSNLPQGLYVVLHIGGYEINLSAVDEFLFIPETEETTGYLYITTEDVTISDDVLETNYLFSNYPNPFLAGSGRTAGTNISFYLIDNSKVSLNIYNIKGQKVNTLIDEKMSSGRHVISWNGIDSRNKKVASGVYFYQLRVDEKNVMTRKMLLLK